MNPNAPVEIIKDESGSHLTPSVVSFRPEGNILIGTAANNQIAKFPFTTIFNAKRLIGHKFTSPPV